MGVLKKNFTPKFILKLSKYSFQNKTTNDELIVKFNSKLLRLEVKCDLKYYKQRKIQITPASYIKNYGLKPNKLSSYVNLRASYHKENSSDFSTLRISPNININTYVLEADFLYSTSEEEGLLRGPVRIVKDDEKHAIRYSAGDIQYSGISFMNQRSLGGLMVSKEFSITPNISTAPVGEKEFILYDAAKVLFFVNNRLTQILELAKGRYNATDFPISDGVNEIRVEIEYYDGRKETLIFPFVTSFELLKKGISQYNIAVGFNEELSSLSKKYSNDKTISMFYKYGLLSDITTSGFLQTDQEQSILGADILLATMAGKFRFETAFSEVYDSSSTGVGARGNYYYQMFSENSHYLQDIAFRYQYISPSFSRLGQLEVSNKYSHTVSTNYKKQISRTSFINLGASYLISHDDNFDSLKRINMGYQDLFYKKLNFSLNFSYNQKEKKRYDKIITLYLNYSFEDHKHYSSLYYDSLSRTSRASLRGNYNALAGQLYSSASIENSKNTNTASGRVDHKHSRVESYLGYDLDIPKESNELKKRHNIRLGVAASLSLVGGELAFGRPITSSFAIVSQGKSLIREKLLVNPSEGDVSPKSDYLGNLVVTNLSEYQSNNVFIDSTESKDGAEFLPRDFKLIPSYKSGFLINIITTKTYNIHATINFDHNSKLALTWGNLKKLDSTGKDPKVIAFFTDENAETFISGLSSGQYEITIFSKETYKTRFNIKNESSNDIELGDIYVK